MWFKNLIVYRLPADWSMSAVQLEEQLATRLLRPCGGFDMQTRGWVAPAQPDRLVHTLNRHHLIALGIDQKLLPASVINQTTKERAAQLAIEQGFPVGRRQLRELKERVTEELRGRAFTFRRTTHAWIDPDHGRLIVDSGSSKRAEELIETLHDTLGSFAAQPLDTTRSPTVSMGAWLTFGDAPGRFNIEQDLELQAADDSKAVVRYVRHPLEAKEVQRHISSGKSPTRLGLSWNDRLSFVLNAELQLKRVQFLDLVKDRAEEQGEAEEEQFDIDFALMTGELSLLLDDLIEALGGESREEQLVAA